MEMEDKEKIIREQRTIEATKKGFMGLSGKLGCILRYVGQPIIAQYDESSYYADPINGQSLDPFVEMEEDYIKHMGMGGLEEPTGNEWMQRNYEVPETHLANLGWHYDGLSQGWHLEISYFAEDKKIITTFKGFVVYLEITGELKSYVPNDEWESIIEKLYVRAKQKEKLEKSIIKKENTQQVKRNKQTFLDKMKALWGV